VLQDAATTGSIRQAHARHYAQLTHSQAAAAARLLAGLIVLQRNIARLISIQRAPAALPALFRQQSAQPASAEAQARTTVYTQTVTAVGQAQGHTLPQLPAAPRTVSNRTVSAQAQPQLFQEQASGATTI